MAQDIGIAFQIPNDYEAMSRGELVPWRGGSENNIDPGHFRTRKPHPGLGYRFLSGLTMIAEGRGVNALWSRTLMVEVLFHFMPFGNMD